MSDQDPCVRLLSTDLLALDVIVSRAKAKNLKDRLFHTLLEYHQKKYYLYETKANHVRLCLGQHGPYQWVIDFTYPRCVVQLVEPWMLDPDYGHVYRYQVVPTETEKSHYRMVGAVNKWEGTGYDWLQLLGVGLGWKWLQLGKNREICSSGARKILEEVLQTNVFPGLAVWRTPPAAFGNSVDFVWMNGIRGKEPVEIKKEEPERRMPYEIS